MMTNILDGLVVLVPYEGGQEFSGWDVAYLPVYVATQDHDLALMAVAYEACMNYRYVAFPSSRETEEIWQERGYPGTLQEPGIDLPDAEEAYQIPEPGDCFCCGNLDTYEVLSLPNMIQRLQADLDDFMLQTIIDSKDDPLWQELNQWIEKYLGDLSLAEHQKTGLSMPEAIDQIKTGVDRINGLVEAVLACLQEDADAGISPELETLSRDGKKLQSQFEQWLGRVLAYTAEHPSLLPVEEANQEGEEEEMTIAEAIAHLREPISTALDRGYSLAEVAEMLTEQGIEIDASTLKQHLRR